MTKKEIIEALKDVDDDEDVRLMCFFDDECVGEYLHDVHISLEDEMQDGITLVGHY